MNTFDRLSSTFIGFDDLFNTITSNLESKMAPSYPPYNIIKHDDERSEIQIAAAGFQREWLTVEHLKKNVTIKGKQPPVSAPTSKFQYKGIAQRDFELSFTLGDYIEVDKVVYSNGILSIILREEIPKESQPRQILIQNS